MEVLDALDACRRVFTLLSDDQTHQLPSELSAKCETVFRWYRPDRRRSENYAEVTARIMTEVLNGGPIGWLTWGNPRILDSVSENLVRGASEAGRFVTVLPAVSSIDTVLVDVGHDPADGLLIVEATSIVVNQTPILPMVAVLLLQPGVFGTHYPRLTAESPKADLARLRSYLLKYYAPDHRGAFVSSSPSPFSAASVYWSPIGDLPDVPPEALRSSTLYIPAATRGSTDAEFLTVVESAH